MRSNRRSGWAAGPWRVARLAAAGLAAAFLAAAPRAQDAAIDVPKPGCAAPEVPEQFATERDQNLFVEAARAFETCITAFIEAERKRSEAHAQAGNEAAAEFNRFAAAAAAVKPPVPK